MPFAGARQAEQEQIGAFLQPAVASGECHDLRFADHGHRIELETVERLAGWQAGFVEMTLDPATGSFGHLVLGERGRESVRPASLLVGSCGKVRPDELDRGQAEIGKGKLRRAVSIGSAAFMPLLQDGRCRAPHRRQAG